jgi:hypothetical protein
LAKIVYTFTVSSDLNAQISAGYDNSKIIALNKMDDPALAK